MKKTRSRVTHDFRANAIASANAAHTAKTLAIRREWGNAYQEINASRDQEPINHVDLLKIVQHGPIGAGEDDDVWNIFGMPTVVQAEVASAGENTNDVRAGRSINVKSLDLLWDVRTEYLQNGQPIGTTSIRRLIILDKQPRSGLVVNAQSIFSGVLFTADERNINGMPNRDNERRYVVLADNTKAIMQYGGGATGVGHITWADHLDLNLKVTFDQAAGTPNDVTDGQIFVTYIIQKQEGSGTDRVLTTVKCNERVCFEDM